MILSFPAAHPFLPHDFTPLYSKILGKSDHCPTTNTSPHSLLGSVGHLLLPPTDFSSTWPHLVAHGVLVLSDLLQLPLLLAFIPPRNTPLSWLHETTHSLVFFQLPCSLPNPPCLTLPPVFDVRRLACLDLVCPWISLCLYLHPVHI